ncbi:MAG: hypothetical protein K0S33_1283 [Bacteroidetes bacterium]|jgi:hypothetical protein|nr:hypothetical protein [Bacteroidota bacterium]
MNAARRDPAYFSCFLQPVLLFIFLFFCTSFFSQNQQIEYDAKEVQAATKFRMKPALLVEALTKNKSSDKEKFDAIFAWVATTIRYDYRVYYSSSGTPMPKLERILKYKHGVCLDYAYLMDTLCSIADIRSYSVYGYSKAETFDLNDSLFADNHAWNAVRLDGEWYLYDVTWASGKTDIQFKPFGKWLKKKIENWPVKTKKIVFKNKFKCPGKCPPEYFEKVPKKFEYTYTKYKHKWLLNLLLHIPLKYALRYNHSLDSSFYLCDPRIFFITHYPDNPVWTLLPGKTIRDFSSDSAYYYLSENTYKDQNVQGTVCPACDETIGYEPLKKNEDLLEKSFASNPKNRFMTFECEFNIAALRFAEADFATDSATKIKFVDTTLTFLKKGNTSLEKSRLYSGTDFSLQKKKNAKKLRMLADDNKGHRLYSDRMIQKTSSRINDWRKLEKNIHIALNKYTYQLKFLSELKTNLKTAKENNPELEKELREKMETCDLALDSLNKGIADVKNKLEDELPIFKDSIWKKLDDYYLFLEPFKQKLSQRYAFKDDYKKEIVDLKKQIEKNKVSFVHQLDSGIFNTTEKIIALFSELSDKVKERSALNKTKFDLLSKLVKNNSEPPILLESLKNQQIVENIDIACWLYSKRYTTFLAGKGLSALHSHLHVLKDMLQVEYWQEGRRFRFVNKELERRLYQEKGIVNNNKRVNTDRQRKVKEYKRKYLKSLKEEARKNKIALKQKNN